MHRDRVQDIDQSLLEQTRVRELQQIAAKSLWIARQKTSMFQRLARQST